MDVVDVDVLLCAYGDDWCVFCDGVFKVCFECLVVFECLVFGDEVDFVLCDDDVGDVFFALSAMRCSCVCGLMPSLALTTRIAASTIAAPESMVAMSISWPGASMKLT